MTQAAFAAAIGVPVATLRNWEQNRTRMDPSTVALMRLIAADPKNALVPLARSNARRRA